MLQRSQWLLKPLTALTVLTMSSAASQASDRITLTGHLTQKEAMTVPAAPEFELIDLEMPGEELPAEFSMMIEIEGVKHQIEVSRYSLRGPDFKVLVDDGLQLNEIKPSDARTYKGAVQGVEDSRVRASLLENGLHAMIDLGDDEGTWFVQPLASFENADEMAANVQGASERTHVVLTDSYVVPEGFGCGNVFTDDDYSELDEDASNDEGGLAGGGFRLFEIGTDTDYEFFVKNSSNVDSTLNDVEFIWNISESIYEDDVQINFELTTIVIRASPSDPYSSSTNAETILTEFRQRWSSTANAEYRIKRDVAHIFTGKNVSNGVLGLAYVGTVCNQNLAFAMVESKWTSNLTFRVAVSVHELGHNFSAQHCDQVSSCSSQPCRIMCSSAGGCDSISGSNLKFETCAVNSIVGYHNSATCDTLVGEDIQLPFSESFEASISFLVWPHNKGGISTTNATGEVDGTRSLNLDSVNSGEYSDDEIRSQRMNASNFSPMYLGFHTQHKGVEAGKSLRVEYVNSSNDWVTLDSIISDGTNQTAFVFQEYLMPADAQTARFRLRFITEGSSTTDDWYIDMITITNSSQKQTPCPADYNSDGNVDGVDLAFLLGNWGLLAGDIDGDGTTTGSDLAMVLAAWGSCP